MILVFALLTAVLVFSLIATGWLSDVLRRRRIMDVPGDRSSHTVSTPRGGGLAIVASVIVGTGIGMITSAGMEAGTLFLLAGATALAGLSWIDDLKSLPPWVRFAAHIIVVAATLPMLGIEGTILPFDLPVWLDRLLVAIAWLGFLNFFNFMDGIDGISVVETVVIGGGILLVLCAVESMDADMLPLAMIVVASIGFGWWNWSPARLFMGDVGSVFLGYLLGGYLILLASEGFLAAAIILPAYYLVDAITTLVRRALKGERVWQAHRQHFYQQAVQAGLSHATVSFSILCTGLVLIALALVSLSHPFLAIGLAILLSAALCFWLPRAGGRRDS